MIRIVLILSILFLMILLIAHIAGCGSKTTGEQVYDDEEEADFEIDYNADSVIRNKRTSETEHESEDIKTPEPANNEPGVAIITGAKAREIYESNDAVVLLDVRNQDEYDEYHLPGSVLIPVNELESRLPELPDKDALIIVFCRAGRRSAIAAEILLLNGYKNIYDMQGIENWQ